MSRGGWLICCVPGWGRLWCILDNVNHALARKDRDAPSRWICDKHDDRITRHHEGQRRT